MLFASILMPLGHADDSQRPVKPVLAVKVVKPQREHWTRTVTALGWIVPWDEASVSTEIGGLRIEEILVDIGDRVTKGQVLARLSKDAIESELRHQEAAVGGAEAALEQASANADRARQLADASRGTLSQKDIQTALIAEKAALANLAAERANLDSERLKLARTQVRAIDDGVISEKFAALGAVPDAGAELFRLIRKNRIEWQAEVSGNDLESMAVGQNAIVANGRRIVGGTVRIVPPAVDRATGRATLQVDLPKDSGLTPGTYAEGTIEVGQSAVLTVPVHAVTTRNGSSHLYRLRRDDVVEELKIDAGERRNDRIEIVSPLDTNIEVVESGGSFLFDGARVVVVPAETAEK
ncbi:RND family efflux transporter MFP subunit [Rhodopseudomonas julia]|uniref:RND family efflux transporter MFP subunit n=1 Tax=Rhodopseudomonas julia TaxID=200617 RepID=A0ABU0C5R8_9BRAD|nr:efflux RND transporter periplasmic adaptor subunit [Rhodopseudomonas julia]MDQ0325849.1 RND family efflux transporter MFP subunit [Rhodopseudomonas julia]